MGPNCEGTGMGDRATVDESMTTRSDQSKQPGHNAAHHHPNCTHHLYTWSPTNSSCRGKGPVGAVRRATRAPKSNAGEVMSNGASQLFFDVTAECRCALPFCL